MDALRLSLLATVATVARMVGGRSLPTAAAQKAPGAAAAAKQAGGAAKKPADDKADDVALTDTPKRTIARVTDEEVCRAIDLGRKHLIGLQKADGSWPGHAGMSALIFMTLAYLGEHPNHQAMTRGLDYLVNADPRRDFGGRQGYGVPIRIMGLSYIHNKLLGDKRALVRAKMGEDLLLLQAGQARNGGWRYTLNANDFDFSVTQWPILAMREANLVGVEFPTDCLLKARELYYKGQHQDGGWSYTLGDAGAHGTSTGSMTAAGLASVFIITDVLEPSSGCPCKNGQSQAVQSEAERRIDSALTWLGRNFRADQNPGKGGQSLYWLYCVERVGIAAGYKRFGDHDWYQEGARLLLSSQGQNGSWGDAVNTCFALLFLYKGRAPVLFNKLKFDGTWNAHRRDAANLTHYFERNKEQPFHWQIVELRAPLEELHDAPVLYITAESAPKWGDAEKKKLRAFTDTGGTVLFEASCGNPAVRSWFIAFAKDVWPEWKIGRLPQEHPIWKSVHEMKQRPEVLGIDDGIRTAVFYCPDDVSCAWQTRALTTREYLFQWGMNLYTYATDSAPLRGKLAASDFEKSARHGEAVKAGPRTALRVARIRHGGDWNVGANYGAFRQLAAHLKSRAGLSLEANEAGAGPADLAGCQAAYVTGTAAFSFKPEEQELLRAYTAGGGILWFEASLGSLTFDKSLRQLAADMKWELRMLPPDHPLMSGRMAPAQGHNLTAGVEFKPSIRVQRIGRPYADLYGLFDGERMVGVYSPLDAMYCLTGCEAFRCRGYKAPDALAVATNISLYLSTLK